MFHRVIALPDPFLSLELFALVEPVAETDEEVVYRHRLYLVDRHAEGGKVLIKDRPAYSVPKPAAPHGEGR